MPHNGYFEEFLNEFQQYYCAIGELEGPNLVNLLDMKLPKSWNIAMAESIVERPLQRFSVGGVMARKQLRGVENFCYKVLDTSTNWGL